jgi:hypothetical protein
VIVVGQVEEARCLEASPLVYWGGSYRQLAPA